MHALQAHSPWARSSPVLSGSRGNTPLRRLTRHARAYKGAHCSQDFHTHNRDNPAAHPFDDPHKTPPPRPAAAAAHQHHAPQPPPQRPEPEPEPSLELPSSLSTSDLEFGADAITGSTLETPEQLAHKYRHPHQDQRQREREERLHQADIAREAAEDSIDDALFMSARDVEDARLEEEAAAARAALAAGESTAAEREERFAGVMQALDSLGASDACGASDDEGQALSPDAARMTASESVEHKEEAAFDTLRHTVDMLGEGDEAAELIMESYKGRNLEAEALSTLDPSDTMPHPGDRYLRPSAARAREPQPGGMEARLNSLRSGPDFESRRGPPLPPARGAIGSRGQQPRGRRGGGSAWMPPEGCSTAPRSSHDPVEDGGEAEARGGGHGTALTRAGANGPRTGAGAMGAGSADDQIGMLDAWRHDGPVGADPAGSAAGTADDQIDFEQDILRGADAMYYAPEHAATPAVNAAAVGGSGVDAEAPGGAYDVEGDALQGGDAMFYFKSTPSPGPGPGPGQGSAGGTADGGARPGRGEGKAEEDRGTVRGALSSRDEQDRSFRNATHDAAAAEASGQLYAKDRQAGTGGAQPPPAEAAEPSSAQPPDAALNKGPASAASSADGGPCEGPYQQGMPSSLRRQQGERREAERRLEGSPGRLKRTREPGDPEPPPPLVRVLETALGRSAALGLCAALSSELLTQQSVLSQLLGRYEGSLQIELARSSSQAAALAVLAAAALLTIVERAVSNSQVPRWRVLGLSPTAQVWLGRSAMLLFALLLAYETVHSNRPAFGTLFYLWP